MVFCHGGVVKQGSEIEIVSVYKYLGLYFTPDLIWTKIKVLLGMQERKAATSIFWYKFLEVLLELSCLYSE